MPDKKRLNRSITDYINLLYMVGGKISVWNWVVALIMTFKWWNVQNKFLYINNLRYGSKGGRDKKCSHRFFHPKERKVIINKKKENPTKREKKVSELKHYKCVRFYNLSKDTFVNGK